MDLDYNKWQNQIKLPQSQIILKVEVQQKDHHNTKKIIKSCYQKSFLKNRCYLQERYLNKIWLRANKSKKNNFLL